MRKTIITVLAFMVMFGFAVSGAMAQTWTWNPPEKVTNASAPFTDFWVNPADGLLYGLDGLGAWQEVSSDGTEVGIKNGFTDQAIPTILDAVAVPPFVAIDGNTVGIWDGSTGYVPLADTDQPVDVPLDTGNFKFIAGANDGTTTTIYVIYETTGIVVQYVLEGTASISWDTVTVRFTPRSLNLGSHGKWITCQIADLPSLPQGYTSWADALDGLCIVGINGIGLAEPICRATNGPAKANKKDTKLMLKFDRQALASAISAQIADRQDEAEFDPTSTTITLGYNDGEGLSFYDDDIIKTKPAKVKNPR